jgi:hypothetical protein
MKLRGWPARSTLREPESVSKVVRPLATASEMTLRLAATRTRGI